MNFFKQKKILLLGHGGGRTTLLQQIIRQPNKYPPTKEQEIKDQLQFPDSDFIRKQTSKSISNVVRKLKSHNMGNMDEINALLTDSELYTMNEVKKFTAIFSQDTIKSWIDGLIRQNELEFDTYFLEQAETVFSDDYSPTAEDLLHSKIDFNNVLEYNFTYNGGNFKLIDIGQQTNFYKWCHVFTDVNRILFLFNPTNYQIVLYEDANTNLVAERLCALNSIANNKYFKKVPITILITKIDIFKEQLKLYNLNTLYYDYTGGTDFDEAIKFMSTKLKEQTERSMPECDIFLLNNLDTTQVNSMMDKLLPPL